MGAGSRNTWKVPAALVALSLVPTLAGTVRLLELGTGSEATSANARFFAHPIATSIHIVSSLVFALLGAFQFSDGIRQGFPRWHRNAGRVLVPAGLVMALSGLWLTLRMPPAPYDGPALFATRMVVGVAILAGLFLGGCAILHRDFCAHRDWMMRAYALGLGAGTQVITHLPWFVFPEIHSETVRALCMGAGWALNLAACEVILRRSHRKYRATRLGTHET